MKVTIMTFEDAVAATPSAKAILLSSPVATQPYNKATWRSWVALIAELEAALRLSGASIIQSCDTQVFKTYRRVVVIGLNRLATHPHLYAT